MWHTGGVFTALTFALSLFHVNINFSVSHLALVLVNWYVCLMRVPLHPTHWTWTNCSEPMGGQHTHPASKVLCALFFPASSITQLCLSVTQLTLLHLPHLWLTAQLLCLFAFLNPTDWPSVSFTFHYEASTALRTNPNNYCNQASGQIGPCWVDNSKQVLPQTGTQRWSPRGEHEGR